MNCQLCKKHMYSYYDEELSPQFKLEIEHHLEACPSCRWQYELTMAENQVLRNTSDIPVLSPDFNDRVLNAINSELPPAMPDNLLTMSKDRRFHFRWFSICVKSAIAVLLLALCFYVPGFISGGQQPRIAKNDQASLQVPKSTAKDSDYSTAGSITTQKQSMQIIKAPDNELLESTSSDIKLGNSTSLPPQTKSEAANPQLYSGTRMTPYEAGRSERKSITLETLEVSSLYLKNIPEKYKLVSQANCAANQMDYSYQTDDGAETINIKLINSANQDQVIVTEAAQSTEVDQSTEAAVSDRLMIAAAPPAVDNIKREIQVADQKITVWISGNINSDELNILANSIIICRDPNI